MKNLALLVVACFVLWSCESDEETLPEGVLPQEQMVGIIVDLHIAEAKLNEVKGAIEDRMLIFNAYANEIYEQHDTDSLQYKNSHDYYMQRLAIMKGIYQQVSDSLKVLRDSAAQTRQKPIIKKPDNQAKAKS